MNLETLQQWFAESPVSAVITAVAAMCLLAQIMRLLEGKVQTAIEKDKWRRRARRNKRDRHKDDDNLGQLVPA